MKNAKTLYWIVTGLASALMVLSAIPDLLRSAQAVAIIGHLGYPVYLLPFLGTAKVFGVATLLVPGRYRLKEWAYAGLTFDVSGALYSHLTVGDPPSAWTPAVVGLLLLGTSYFLYCRQSEVSDSTGRHVDLPETRTVARAS